MSTPKPDSNNASPSGSGDSNTPTVAAFSPSTPLHSPPATKQRSTILVQQKSPLLVATPPQITRALAYSHPFIVPLNRLAGLLSWTTGDPWESFLLVAAFWAISLYGDAVIRWAGPLLAVIALIIAMYSRRFSPLSSTGWTGDKSAKGHKRADSASLRHHKSLDEIVDELKLFTSRCSILLDPWLSLTEFLSTQVTATTATTRPALTSLFIRILVVTPIWIILARWPFYIITSKRVILAIGTISLTWHSRPARVFRTVLWRSRLLRRISAGITGLTFASVETADSGPPSNGQSALPRRNKPATAHEIAASLAKKRNPNSPGIRFTFTLYENQRRWLGIGWTSSMLAYERAAWTDEHQNTTPPKDRFELPEVEGGHARWRWVDGSEWHVEGADDSNVKDSKDGEDDGWIYYDNKWRDGRRGKDGWGRYTRRRKWCRDAELVEVTPSTEITPSPTPKLQPESDGEKVGAESEATDKANGKPTSASTTDLKDDSSSSQSRKKYWFKRSSQPTSEKSTPVSSGSTRLDDDEDEVHSPYRQTSSHQETWGLGDDAQMELG